MKEAAEIKTSPKTEHQDHPALGMAAGAGAFFMLAVMNVFAKILSESHSVLEIAFYRNAVALLPFLFMIFVMGRKDIPVIRKSPRAIFARSTLGTFSLIITFAAFAAMPMADTTAFLFTASLFIPILGTFFLGEKVGPYRWSAVLIGFVGVIIMVRPTGDINSIGISLALGAAFMHSILGIILRYLGKTESPLTVTFYFILVGTALTSLFMPFVATMPTWQEIPLFIGVGLSGAVAQYLLSVAFSKAPVAVVTVFNYSGIIWATLFGWFIWNDWPTLPIWIGGTIVIASNIFMIWRENRKRKMAGYRIQAKL